MKKKANGVKPVYFPDILAIKKKRYKTSASATVNDNNGKRRTNHAYNTIENDKMFVTNL